jgi:F-type H+-transporting ATPase subunit b
MAEQTTATTEHTSSSEHGGGFPPFQGETFPSQLVWLAVCFVVLYVLVAKLVTPRMRSIFVERSTRIADDLAEAARMKREADEAVAAYEKALAEARARAHALAAETREKLNLEAETHRRRVEEELNGKLAEAERTIAASKQAAMANVRDIASEAAAAIVARLIGTPPPAATVAAAVDDVLKR